MRSVFRFNGLYAAMIAASASVAVANTVVDFDELPLAAGSFYNGGPTTNANGWSSKGALFGNSYNSVWGSWSGFAYSNVNDATTAGFGNQYAAYAGPAFSGSNYAVAYSGTPSFFNLPAGQTPVSVRVTNTTYAALDMAGGSSFSKKFGGLSGDDPDFFRLTFTGYDAPGGVGAVTGSTTFSLADFTFADNAQDYIVDAWELLDLTPLGAARSVRLTWASSDVGAFGINTPTYAALDDLITIPEPASLGAIALLGAVMSRRRNRS